MSYMCKVKCIKSFQVSPRIKFEKDKVYEAREHWWDADSGELALEVWTENNEYWEDFREYTWEDKFEII